MNIYMDPERKEKYRGELIQYTYHSLGRKDLSNKMQVFSFAQKIAGMSDHLSRTAVAGSTVIPCEQAELRQRNYLIE